MEGWSIHRPVYLWQGPRRSNKRSDEEAGGGGVIADAVVTGKNSHMKEEIREARDHKAQSLGAWEPGIWVLQLTTKAIHEARKQMKIFGPSQRELKCTGANSFILERKVQTYLRAAGPETSPFTWGSDTAPSPPSRGPPGLCFAFTSRPVRRPPPRVY